MTEAIYIEVAAKKEELDKKRRVSISGMLKHLGVSRSGNIKNRGIFVRQHKVF